VPLVDVYLNGIEVLAVMDSGAAVSVMSPESANKLKSKRVCSGPVFDVDGSHV
jgi:hypothetical protein